MANLILELVLNGIMALLLLVVAYYCWRLNKRIKILQDSKSELAQIITEFDASTQRATQSIAEIHEATARIAENMQHKIDKANYVADDLQFMIERGGKIASSAASAPAKKASRSDEDPRSSRSSKRRAANDDVDSKAAGASSIETMLKRVRGNKEVTEAEIIEPGEESSKTRRQGARLRSKAEQELFEALKAGGSKS